MASPPEVAPAFGWSLPPTSLFDFPPPPLPLPIPPPSGSDLALDPPVTVLFASVRRILSDALQSRSFDPLRDLPSLRDLGSALTSRAPFTIPHTLFHDLLRPDFLVGVLALYVFLFFAARAVFTRYGVSDRSARTSKSSPIRRICLRSLVILHLAALAIPSALTAVATFRSFTTVWPDSVPLSAFLRGLFTVPTPHSLSENVPVVADALCKIHGPRGFGNAVIWNSTTDAWATTDPTVQLLDGAPDHTDLGRFWNEGLAFWGWIFYLIQIARTTDSFFALYRSFTGPETVIRHLLEVVSAWANVRYMNPAGWIGIGLNSASSVLFYSVQILLTLGIDVPDSVCDFLTYIRALLWFIPIVSGFVYLPLEYDLPVHLVETVTVQVLRKVAVPVELIQPAAPAEVPVPEPVSSPVSSPASAPSGGPFGPIVKKLLLYAAGEVGMAENVNQPAPSSSSAPVPAPAPAPVELPAVPQERFVMQSFSEEKTISTVELHRTRCIDTPGQALATWINFVYILFLLILAGVFIAQTVRNWARPQIEDGPDDAPAVRIGVTPKEPPASTSQDSSGLRQRKKNAKKPKSPGDGPADSGAVVAVKTTDDSVTDRDTRRHHVGGDLARQLPDTDGGNDSGDDNGGSAPDQPGSISSRQAEACLPMDTHDQRPPSPDGDVFPVATVTPIRRSSLRVSVAAADGHSDDDSVPSSPFDEHPVGELTPTGVKLDAVHGRRNRDRDQDDDPAEVSSWASRTTALSSPGAGDKAGKLVRPDRSGSGSNLRSRTGTAESVAAAPSSLSSSLTADEGHPLVQPSPSRIPRPASSRLAGAVRPGSAATISPAPKPAAKPSLGPGPNAVRPLRKSASMSPVRRESTGLLRRRESLSPVRQQASASPLRKRESISTIRRASLAPIGDNLLTPAGLSAARSNSNLSGPVHTIPPMPSPPVLLPTSPARSRPGRPGSRVSDDRTGPMSPSKPSPRPSLGPSPRKMKSVPVLNRTPSPSKAGHPLTSTTTSADGAASSPSTLGRGRGGRRTISPAKSVSSLRAGALNTAPTLADLKALPPLAEVSFVESSPDVETAAEVSPPDELKHSSDSLPPVCDGACAATETTDRVGSPTTETATTTPSPKTVRVSSLGHAKSMDAIRTSAISSSRAYDVPPVPPLPSLSSLGLAGFPDRSVPSSENIAEQTVMTAAGAESSVPATPHLLWQPLENHIPDGPDAFSFRSVRDRRSGFGGHVRARSQVGPDFFKPMTSTFTPTSTSADQRYHQLQHDYFGSERGGYLGGNENRDPLAQFRPEELKKFGTTGFGLGFRDANVGLTDRSGGSGGGGGGGTIRTNPFAAAPATATAGRYAAGHSSERDRGLVGLFERDENVLSGPVGVVAVSPSGFGRDRERERPDWLAGV